MHVRELTHPPPTPPTPPTQRKTGGRRQLCGTLESGQDLDDEPDADVLVSSARCPRHDSLTIRSS